VDTDDAVERLVNKIVDEGRRPIGLSADGNSIRYEPPRELAKRLLGEGLERYDVKQALIAIARQATARAREYQNWADDITKFVKLAKVPRP
jgi:hypothetical protein